MVGFTALSATYTPQKVLGILTLTLPLTLTPTVTLPQPYP